jgi:ATP-binding cassette subfamily B protein
LLGVLAVITAVLTGLQLLIMSRVFSRVVAIKDGAAASTAAPYLVAFVLVFTAVGIIQLVQAEVRRVHGEMVALFAQSMVAQAAASADLIDFERPGFHDRLQRALLNAAMRPVQASYAALNVASSVLTSIGVLVGLAVLQPLMLPVIAAAFVPLWLVSLALSRVAFRFELEVTHDDRRRSYLLQLLTAKSPAKEVRAYGLADYFRSRHEALFQERIIRVREVAKRRIRLGMASRLLNALLLAAILGGLVWLLSSGRSDLPGAAVTAAAVLLLGQRLASIASGVGQLHECALFLDDTNGFLQLIDRARNDEPPVPIAPLEVLRADGLVFRYPASSHAAIDGVTVEVRPGEVVALVGANGSGKTTLAKLLAFLYEPEVGSLTWNGVDTSTIDPRAIRDRVAVIFQDFEQYLFTAAENIGVGRVANVDDRGAVERAAVRAGADVFLESLDDGYDSLLGPEFIGGVSLSIGQWQRVAIARAFFRDTDLIILDEPSSALDPAAEAALFDRVRELGRDRAVVVISHRFSTVASADRIYVLDEGRVVEAGSHSALMSVDGLYAQLFRLQASAYLVEDLAGEDVIDLREQGTSAQIGEEGLGVGEGGGLVDVVLGDDQVDELG